MDPLFLPDDAATESFGRQLAVQLQPGDIVLLTGDLGAGKTALARSVIRTLADDQLLDVPSPSFALVQPYQTPRGQVLHADLYRLADAREADELGLFDNPEAFVLIEWPDRMPALERLSTVSIRIEIPKGGQGRQIYLTSARPLI